MLLVSEMKFSHGWSLHNISEAANYRTYSVKKLLLKFSQYSQESTCVGETPIVLFSCEVCWILKTPILKNICKRMILMFQEELLNSYLSILYFNECLWIF